MKSLQFLKDIHIGEIIRAEMEKQSLTKEILADKMHLEEWIVRDTFKQKSVKINKLIEFSYAVGVNLLQVYLREMPSFGKLDYFNDEVIIKRIDGQICMIPSKRSRTADFTQNIHIGKLLKAEVDKQKMTEETLSEMCCYSQSTISRAFGKLDIDTVLLIRASYALNYDFIRNIYLPYMAVDENEMIANDCIADPFIITIKPKVITITTGDQMGIYDGFWSPK